MRHHEGSDSTHPTGSSCAVRTVAAALVDGIRGNTMVMTGGRQAAPEADAAREVRPAPTAGGDGRLFSARERRAGLAWVAVTIPVAAALGLVAHGERAYLLAWVLVGALNLLPALTLSCVACRRASDEDERFWKLITIGVAVMATIGLLVLAGVLAGSWYPVFLAVPLAVLCVVLFFAALFGLVRARCIIPVNPLDILESTMLVIVACAFAPLAWGGRAVVTTTFWFTGVAAIATIGVLAGFCWSLATFRRVQGQRLPDETLGMAIGFLCGVNAAAQTAQGLTGFALPSAPLLICQAVCFGVLLIMPLQLADSTPSSYDTLPPLEQARTRSYDTIAIALLLPMLVITIARQPQTGWAVWYFVGVASLLLLLALLRGKLSMRETRRLYAEVEQAAESRRKLLADVLQSADHDRHRVAAQLHQQATGFYIAFTSFLRLTDDSGTSPALRGMRDDLEHQADELRELMLAVRPLETNHSGSADLRTTIAAYIDSLHVDAPVPDLDIRVDEGLALDWTTETIVLRILQEALRNVARHAHAQRVIVSIDERDTGVALCVLDDGVGFDAKHLLFESGNEYMRTFASYLDGHVFIESAPGRGTSVRAVLGTPAGRTPPRPTRPGPDGSRAQLHLVTDAGRPPDEGPVDTPATARPTAHPVG